MNLKQSDEPDNVFVAILGLHSSGSSCLAGVLYHLGLYLGAHLIGYYGDDPENDNCGFEDAELCHLCEAAVPTLTNEYLQLADERADQLERWINKCRHEALRRNTIAAGKFPQLCRLGPELISICGFRLRVIASERPIEQSIKSLYRRFPDSHQWTVEEHQRWLQAGKEWILSQLEEFQKLTVEYDRLLDSPESEVVRIAEFLKLHPTESQLRNILRWVNPDKRHISS